MDLLKTQEASEPIVRVITLIDLLKLWPATKSVSISSKVEIKSSAIFLEQTGAILIAIPSSAQVNISSMNFLQCIQRAYGLNN